MQNINPFGEAVSEEKIFNVPANQKQESSMAAMFLSDQDEMRKLYNGPSIDALY